MENPLSTREVGFSLVELIVAISICALMAVLGWRALDGLTRARVRLTAEMEQQRRVQLAFAQMEADCAHLAEFDGMGERTVLLGGSARLVLVRGVGEQGRPLQLQVVSYRLVDGTLLRASSALTRDLARLDMLWRDALDDAHPQPQPQTALQSGLTGMTMRAWVGQRNEWRIGANVAADAPSGRPRVRSPENGLEVALEAAGGRGTVRRLFMLGPG